MTACQWKKCSPKKNTTSRHRLMVNYRRDQSNVGSSRFCQNIPVISRSRRVYQPRPTGRVGWTWSSQKSSSLKSSVLVFSPFTIDLLGVHFVRCKPTWESVVSLKRSLWNVRHRLRRPKVKTLHHVPSALILTRFYRLPPSRRGPNDPTNPKYALVIVKMRLLLQ